MLRFWTRQRGKRREWLRRSALFASGFILCATILAITSYEKFAEGGWITLLVTTLVIALCLVIRRHYDNANARMDQLFAELGDLPNRVNGDAAPPAIERQKPTAAVMVGSYGGVGIHTLLNVFRGFPGFYRNVVFISVGVVDSGEFKGEHAVVDLQQRTEAMLAKYVALANGLGVAATARMSVATEVVAEAEVLCQNVAREFPHVTFFAGKMVFQRERWWHRVLHNETAFAVQKRLQWAGRTMVTLPVRVRGLE
jgi:K+ transporter